MRVKDLSASRSYKKDKSVNKTGGVEGHGETDSDSFYSGLKNRF